MVYFIIGLAGIAGSLVRFALGIWIPSGIVAGFPVDTLLCNLLGSFLLGLLFYRLSVSSLPPLRYKAMGTGFLGSFTTFSAFSLETVHLIRDQHWLYAVVYITASLWGGLLLSFFGFHAHPCLHRVLSKIGGIR